MLRCVLSFTQGGALSSWLRPTASSKAGSKTAASPAAKAQGRGAKDSRGAQAAAGSRRRKGGLRGEEGDRAAPKAAANPKAAVSDGCRSRGGLGSRAKFEEYYAHKYHDGLIDAVASFEVAAKDKTLLVRYRGPLFFSPPLFFLFYFYAVFFTDSR